MLARPWPVHVDLDQRKAAASEAYKRPHGAAREVDERLDHSIPRALPIAAQVWRFDCFKDPEGVIEAFKLARREAEAALVLLGIEEAAQPMVELLRDVSLRQRMGSRAR